MIQLDLGNSKNLRQAIIAIDPFWLNRFNIPVMIRIKEFIFISQPIVHILTEDKQ